MNIPKVKLHLQGFLQGRKMPVYHHELIDLIIEYLKQLEEEGV